MAVVWVQQWWALPVIVEEPQMGDSHPQGGRPPLRNIPSNTSSHARRPEEDDFPTPGKAEALRCAVEPLRTTTARVQC